MKRIISIILAAGAAAVLSTGCTPEEISTWVAWHDQDPDAAMQWAADEFAQPEPEQESGGSGSSVWDRLANCESGGDWGISTGNGYYGGLQFNLGTWRANGGSGYPHQASRSEQIRVAENLRDQAGYAPWPACSKRLGLR